MSEYMEFDCTPYDEDCVSVDSNTDYMPAMRAEARRMIEMLEKRFLDIPGYFRIATCPHDLGSYLEVRFVYQDTDEGNEACCFVENNWPKLWTDSEVLSFNQYVKERDKEADDILDEANHNYYSNLGV